MVLLPRVGRPWNTPDRRDPRSFLDLEILSSPGHCWIQVRKILTVSPFDLTRDGFKWYEFMNGYGGKLRVFVFSSRDVSRYCLNYDRFKGFVLGWVYKNFHFYIAFRLLSKISKGIIYLSRGYINELKYVRKFKNRYPYLSYLHHTIFIIRLKN